MGLLLHDGPASLTLSEKEVRANTRWCQALVPLALEPNELPHLAAGMRKLAEDGHGSFLWSNEGGEVRIEIVMAKRGETHWSVRLQAPPDFLHELRLVFVGRQDDLLDQAENLSR